MYCPKCGSKNEFVNGAKPNFCTNCGHDLRPKASSGGNSFASVENLKTETRRTQSDPQTPRGLEGVTIEGPKVSLRKSVSEVLSFGGATGPRQDKSHSAPKRGREEVLASFKSQASSIDSSRGNNDSIDVSE